MTLKQVLLGIQALLDEPNLASPANTHAYNLLRKDRGAYDVAVKRFAALNKPD